MVLEYLPAGKASFHADRGGILPIGIVMAVSFVAVREQTEERLVYALNQGYSQACQAVQDKLSRVHNISTLLAVNDMLGQTWQLREDELDVAEQLAVFENISSYVYGLEMTLESSSVRFYMEDTYLVVNSQSRRYRPIAEALEARWYQRLEENNGRPVWVLLDGEEQGRTQAAIVRELWNPEDYSQSVGILAVITDRRQLEELLRNSSQDQVMYLETVDGAILASNVSGEELLRLPLSERNVDDQAFRSVSVDNTPCYVRSRLVDGSNVYLVSVIPRQAIRRGTNSVSSNMSVVYLTASILLLLAMGVMTRAITGRLKLLEGQMIRIQAGDIGKIEESQYRDEIGRLISNYNVMADRVEELLQEQYILGQEKAEAQLKALQSQINPHFLYNTLDMINWMSQKNETDNIRNVVHAMSRFYRLTLSKGRDIVAIRDEVQMCEAYMEIQKRRYKGRICYEVEVEDEILDCLIPKITLQPFLENAIIHGINEKEDGRGVVILNGWQEDGRITLSVTDDGDGMTVEDREKSPGGSHYGLSNIEHRLELFFGERIPVQIESSLGIGTCVIISIPMRSGEKEAAKGEAER